MNQITQTTQLNSVEHILASGTGILDFAIEDESAYRTWEGTEDSDWSIEDIESVENADEDRFVMYPRGAYFRCEIDADRGVVRCWCEE